MLRHSIERRNDDLSLLYWLPMLGSLKNQGLSEATPVNHGATINNSGKLGKCYSFSGSSQYIDTGFKESISTGDFTISAWVKLTSDTTKTYQPIISNKTTAANSVGFAIYFNHNQNKFLWSTADGTNATEIWTTDTFANVYNTWTHVVMVRNSSDPKIGYFYINGERQDLASVPPVRNITNATYNMIIGDIATHNNAAYLWTGDICDVRIYDEAIPPKLAKELSKGLVLHYPLNRGGFGQDNIIKNSSLRTNYDGWTKSGSLAAPEFTVKDGYECIHFTGELQKNASYAPCFTTNNTRYLGVQAAGNTYTLSFDVLFENVVKGTTNYHITFYKSGETVNGTWVNPSVVSNSGHMTSATSDILDPSKLNGAGWQTIYLSIRFGDYNWSNANYSFSIHLRDFTGDVYIKNAKVETGLVHTPWLPNSADALYSSMGLDDNIEYDVSGYQNNGTITGSLTCSSDTPRYMVSTVFDSGMNIESVNPLATCSEFTITGWINLTTGYAINNGFHLMGFDGTYCRICISKDSKAVRILLTNGTTNYMGGSTMEASSLVAGEWNHYAVTFDNGSIKVYINGVLDSTATATITSITFPSNHIRIGRYGTEQPKGKASDIRFYATALSADDILALYNTPASIASNGTLLTQGEISEV